MRKEAIIFIFLLVFSILLSYLSAATHLSPEAQKIQISLWNDQIIKYAQGSSSLSLERINQISQQRKDEMLDLMKRDILSFFQLTLSEEIRDKLSAEARDNIENAFEEAGRITSIIIEKKDGEEEIFNLERGEKTYHLFLLPTIEISLNNYYRISGVSLDNSAAVQSITPLLGVQRDNPAINLFSVGEQYIAFILFSFKDNPFSYDTFSEQEIYKAIDDFVDFYLKSSGGRMNIKYKIFRYTLDRDCSSCSPDAGDLLGEMNDLDKGGKFDFIPPEYNTLFGIISEDFAGSTIGIAYVGYVGWDYRGMGLAKLLYDKDYQDKRVESSLISHEIGHTRGLGHVDTWRDANKCIANSCLMWPSLSPTATIDRVVFLPKEITQLNWDSHSPMPLTISNIKVWPIANIQGVPTGASLLWNTNFYASSEVSFGTDQDDLQGKGERSSIESPPQSRFELRGPKVDGKPTPLQLNTVYYYRIVSTRDQDSVKKVTTERRGSFFMADKYWTGYPEIPENQKAFGVGIVDQSTSFLRGDANEDANVDISDAVYILEYLFRGRTSPLCQDTADANDDGKIDLSDAVTLLDHLFKSQSLLPEPSEDYGFDPTLDRLKCEVH